MNIFQITSQLNALVPRVQTLDDTWSAPPSADTIAIRVEAGALDEELRHSGGRLFAAIEGFDLAQEQSAFELPMIGKKLRGLGFGTSLHAQLALAQSNLTNLLAASRESALAFEGKDREDAFIFVMPSEDNPFQPLLKKLQSDLDDVRDLFDAFKVNPDALLAAAKTIRRGDTALVENAEWQDDQELVLPRLEHGSELFDESELGGDG